MSLNVGEKFPQVKVATRSGHVDLAEKWSAGPVVIAFHRIWCPFCQQAAIELSSVAPELQRLGATTVIVYREDADTVARTCDERQTDALCVSDPDRGLEKAVELKRFHLSRYAAFSPRRLFEARRAGARLGSMKADILQGRGTFVVDRAGRVVYVHLATTAADIPPIDEVINAVRAAS